MTLGDTPQAQVSWLLPHPGIPCNITTRLNTIPGGSSVKNPPTVRETWVPSLGWEDPLEKGTATHSSI